MLGGKFEGSGMQLAFPNARVELKVRLELQLVDHSRWIYEMCLIGDHTKGSSQPPANPAGAPPPARVAGATHPVRMGQTLIQPQPDCPLSQGKIVWELFPSALDEWLQLRKERGGGGNAPAGLAGGRLDPTMWPCFEFNEENLNDHKL